MFLVRQRRFGNTFFLRVLVRLRGGAETVRFRAGVREIEEFSTTSRRAVALADIDGDDAVDIVRVAGTTKGNVVRLYFNDGSGGFLSRRLEDGGTSPEEVALVDFDGDDLPELLTTFSSPPRLTLRRNLGDRQFGEPLALQSAGQPRTVLAEDLDQDGRVDLVILPENDSRPFFLWNQGNEAFERVPFERLPIETVDIDAADFDGDGRRDVVLRDESTIVLLRNRGGRTFEALDRLATGLQLSGLAVDDLDGDRHPDVVVSVFTPQSVVILPNRAGELTPPPAVRPAPSRGRAKLPFVPLPKSLLAVGDFDADGDADLAVRDESDSLKIFLKTNGLQITRESLVARVDGLRGVAAGDLDNDGDLDLVAAALDDAAAPRASIQVFANAGRGRFLAGESQAVDSLAVDLVLSDLDRDGALDIVFGPELGYLRGHGDGTFDGPSRIDAGNRDGANLHAADFDGDGYPDLLVTRSRTGDDLATEVFVLFNESSAARPRFRSAVSVRRRAAPDALLTDLAVADMDADGNPDILVGWTCPSCAIMGRPAEILLSDGQGRFAGGDPVEFGLFQFPQFFPGDVDGDGDQDVVVQTAGHAFLSYENLGDGTFVRVGRTLFARERPFQIPAALADFDGNGDLELVDLSSGVVEFYDILGRPPLRDANRDGVPDDCETFRRGDANADGRVNVTDAVTTLIELFARRGAVKCFDGADVNDDGALDITDAIRTLEIVFTGDLPVPPPGALACGPDPSVDALPLCTYPRELCRN